LQIFYLTNLLCFFMLFLSKFSTKFPRYFQQKKKVVSLQHLKMKIMIAKPVEVKALNDYSIFVEFADGMQGVVDLKHLANKGIFCNWDKNNLFSQVHIDNYGAITWSEEIDICPDSIYLQLKGITFEQWKQQNLN
jgi:hypothetical protein